MTANEKLHIPNFLQFKANLRFSNVFEDITYDEYRIHYNYRALTRTTLAFDQLQDTQLDFLKETHPKAFLSFHIGPYRAIPKLLIENGIDIVLLVDEGVFQKQKEELLSIHKAIEESSEKGGDFILLSVQDKSSILQVKRLINKGYSLFLYLDGNTGQEVSLNHKNSEEIDFYNMKLTIRNGIAKLIHLFKLQPILLLNYWEDNSIQLKTLHLDRNNLIQEAYTYLQDTMNTKEKILQWECWLYCEKWISTHTEQRIPSSQQAFDPLAYELLQLESNYFLFRLEDLQVFQISEPEYNFLTQAKSLKINQFRQMIQNGILAV